MGEKREDVRVACMHCDGGYFLCNFEGIDVRCYCPMCHGTGWTAREQKERNGG